MDFKVTLTANARELANALIVLDENIHRIKTDAPVLDQLSRTAAPLPEPAKNDKPVKHQKKAATPVPAPTDFPVDDDAPEGDDEAQAEDVPAAVDLETLRELVQAKSKAGYKTAIVALLKKFKVKTIPDLDASQYADFYQKVNAL